MRYLFEKIKYSEFYKKYLRGLKITSFLRWIRFICVLLKKRIHEWRSPSGLRGDLRDTFDAYLTLESIEQPRCQEPVDVIVPIYNGYEFLVRLFKDLTKTDMNCRYILVDDQSPDERVQALEKEFIAGHNNAILIENDRNYGFVKTVNNGLDIAKGHVALINSDTELPQGWLERLMAPILEDEKVASTTPYTNSGTIYSFPNFGVNNKIYLGCDVDTIDSFFEKVRPRYVEVPTGVGFCMGMSRKALDEVGVLDYDTFDRGYGEENDWCQRAKKRGYKNVHVENLFVYHKHGGSFVSEEKQRLIDEHLAKLIRKHPTYNHQVQKFITRDPNQKVRVLAQLMMNSYVKESVIFFDHGLGGGATSYLNMQAQKLLGAGVAVTVVRYVVTDNRYEYDFYLDWEHVDRYASSSLEDILYVGQFFHFDKIYINELVTYPDLWKAQEILASLKKQQAAELIMLFHDYFAVCPSINLLDQGKIFCRDATGDVCQQCYERNGYGQIYGCHTHKEWIENWKKFLVKCTEVRCFSQDTLSRVEKIYGDELTYTLVPHQVDYVFPIHKNTKTTDTINIGLLGVLAIHKGGELIQQLLEIIERENLNMNICLIGWPLDLDFKKYTHFKYTGEYKAEQLAELVYENDIDAFFISSIWPETFSYTAEEVIKMGMPLASFEYGAPAERIRKYDKGMIIDSKSTPEEIVIQLESFARQQTGHMTRSRKKVLYVAEYLSFSSRYRLEHLKEELLHMGVEGDFYSVKSLPKNVDWNQYKTLVVYRCRYRDRIAKLIDSAKLNEIQVVYDIDDLIFDIDQMDFMPDFDQEVYGDFEQYSEEIKKCMEMSDKILVSTDTLKEAVKKTFGKEKKVFVNRNMASSQMLVLSARAKEYKVICDDTFVLGYFSGSNTHDEDFALIAPAVHNFMKIHEDVRLRIVGCMGLQTEFDDVSDRIDRVEFIPWQELPREIAVVDVNLMPLQDTFFHHCKSENKWMEAALVEVVTVASYYKELENNTMDHDNIIMCQSEEQWEETLEYLYKNREECNRIAKNAFEYAVENKTTLLQNKQLLKYIEE